MNRKLVFAAMAAVTLAAAASIANAGTLVPAQRAAQFQDQEMQLQRESTPMPAASTPVARTAAAAPLPHAMTRAERAQRFIELEREMQAESSG
jgi:hypothetical protein